MTRLLILADPNSAHTIKWVRGLSERGFSVDIFGINYLDTDAYGDLPDVEIFTHGYKDDLFRKRAGSLSKLKYLLVLKHLKKIILEKKPDILHAHFATSYGFLAAMTNFHPLVLSVWGSDVYHFPTISVLHKSLLKYNLSRADRILSTSRIMAEEIKKYTPKSVTVTPFGINTGLFRPIERVESIFDKGDTVIGIIKTLEPWYGVNLLIEAFARLKKKYPSMPLKLLIAGKGSEEKNLKKLAADLGVDKLTKFTGHLDYADLPLYHNMIDIAVYPSLKESFGVSVIEASACEKPVVVANVGGHPEIVDNEVTGFIVESGRADSLTDAIEKLLLNNELRGKMGRAGRMKVEKEFNFNDNLDQMTAIYSGLIKR